MLNVSQFVIELAAETVDHHPVCSCNPCVACSSWSQDLQEEIDDLTEALYRDGEHGPGCD